MPDSAKSLQNPPNALLLDMSVVTDYLAGDPGAASLVEKALSGEVAVSISTLTALQLWRTHVDDRRSEIRLIALLKFVNQVPVTEDHARIAGQIRPLSGDPSRPREEAMVSINVVISQALGLAVCTRDIRTYQDHGCETVEY